MARRQHLARWAAALCLATAATVHFPAPAGALEARVGVALPPLPLPVTLPTEVAITLSLPILGGESAQGGSATAGLSQPQAVPGQDPGQFPPVLPTPSPVTAPRLAPPADTGSLPTVPTSHPSTRPDEPDRGMGPTVRRFSLPLGLTAALIAFLAVQALVDRRDPKLAGAAMDDEVFGFR